MSGHRERIEGSDQTFGEHLRPVVGVPDRHTFHGIVTLTHYGDGLDIDVGGTDLVEFLERMEGRRVHIEVVRYS